MKKKKIEETVTDTTKIETKVTTEVDTTQRLENIEKLLNEIVDILKRKHPSSTDIFGK